MRIISLKLISFSIHSTTEVSKTIIRLMPRIIKIWSRNRDSRPTLVTPKKRKLRGRTTEYSWFRKVITLNMKYSEIIIFLMTLVSSRDDDISSMIFMFNINQWIYNAPKNAPIGLILICKLLQGNLARIFDDFRYYFK